MIKKHSKGFTFVEILVIAPIVILAIGSFIALIVVMSGDVLAARAQNVLAYNIQDALNRMEKDIRSSSRFLAVNSFSLIAAQGYDNGTSGFKNVDTTRGPALILEQTATTANPALSPSSFAYLSNQPYNCANPSLRENQIMMINIVYFIKDSTLWRRTLMPSNYTTAACNTPWQKPSCSPGYSAAFCQTPDTELVKGVSITDFDIQYYLAANSTTPDATVSNPATADNTRASILETLTSANVAIRASTVVAGRDVTWSGSLRATRIP